MNKLQESLRTKALIVKARKFYRDEQVKYRDDFNKEGCLEDIHRMHGIEAYNHVNNT